jgi:hypothetical protein
VTIIKTQVASGSHINNINDNNKPALAYSEIDVELDWIKNLRDQAEFLNTAMKHYCVLFKVQRREFLMEGT